MSGASGALTRATGCPCHLRWWLGLAGTSTPNGRAGTKNVVIHGDAYSVYAGVQARLAFRTVTHRVDASPIACQAGILTCSSPVTPQPASTHQPSSTGRGRNLQLHQGPHDHGFRRSSSSLLCGRRGGGLMPQWQSTTTSCSGLDASSSRPSTRGSLRGGGYGPADLHSSTTSSSAVRDLFRRETRMFSGQSRRMGVRNCIAWYSQVLRDMGVYSLVWIISTTLSL